MAMRVAAFIVLAALGYGVAFPGGAFADVILCQSNRKIDRHKFITRIPPKRCPKNYRFVANIPDIFGNASAGDVTITSAAQFRALTNFQFGDFTISLDAGDVETRSGLVIRATGTCTINEEFEVNPTGSGGTGTPLPKSGVVGDGRKVANEGAAESGAANGEVVVLSIVPSETADGAEGGKAHDEASLRAKLAPELTVAGGGGGGGQENSVGRGAGGGGGGSIVMHCREGIIIGSSGSIEADGSNSGAAGGGGGAGGMVILTSRGAIVNSGSINVSGGNGGAAGFNFPTTASYGPGGGGSGGVVHLIAPNVTAGVVNVTGGSGRDAGTIATSQIHVGGSGGGALGGDGGNGGSLASDGSHTSSEPGEDGLLFISNVRPEALFE